MVFKNLPNPDKKGGINRFVPIYVKDGLLKNWTNHLETENTPDEGILYIEALIIRYSDQ